MKDYFDIQKSIEFARQEIVVATQTGETDDIINVCERLLNLIDQLNERDAPQ